MDKSNTLTILKNAFLIERKGKSLYEKAMDHAKDEAVKDFFKDL
ncbi:MAG: rubrerythrin, partial [Desulfobacula sp.]|nr:rubrerythrin [Desulfobacula sp.]